MMTRCIHCTRCVRFTTEVAGISELGLLGRGEDAEITTYLEQAMTSELQGNVIDLCPVGALTSKPYAFQARPWELTKTESIDVMDAVGSAIRVDSRGREVMRILPRVNEAVNEEWISDKTRFIWDGLRPSASTGPMSARTASCSRRPGPKRSPRSPKLSRQPRDKIGAIAGDLAGVEEMFALKALMTALGSANHRLPPGRRGARPVAGPWPAYLFNPGIAGIEHADAILLVGSNPRARGSGPQRPHPQALARGGPACRSA